MKTYLYIGIAVLIVLFQSCTKNFEEINTDPTQFNDPGATAIFTGIVKNTADQMQRNNMSYFWSYSHHITVTAGTGRYLTGNDGNWDTWYVDVLGNIKQLKNFYGNTENFNNRLQIVEIWECYVYAYLVGTYGNVPYSQAMDPELTIILFDDENAIYESLLDRLKVAAERLDASGDRFDVDLVFDGDIVKWRKFANSLRLRLALRTMRNLQGIATQHIQSLMANESELFSVDADLAFIEYGTGEGNESQYYVSYVRNNPAASVIPKMSDYLMLYFRAYRDPRMEAYFEPSPVPYVIPDTLASLHDDILRIVTYPIPYFGLPKSTQVLGSWGLTNNPFPTPNDDNYSPLNPGIMAASHRFVFMDYAEVLFLKAEAAYLNFGGSQTAQQYYSAGIDANFRHWGLSTVAAEAYKEISGIKWDTEGQGYTYRTGTGNSDIPADNLAKIWVQRWINYYVDGAFDAWCLQRRTQSLALPPHTNHANPLIQTVAFADIPDRWEYPLAQRAFNAAGYEDNLQKMGGIGSDIPRTRLKFALPGTYPNWANFLAFWDIRYAQKWYGHTIQDLEAQGIPYDVIDTIDPEPTLN